MLYDLNSVYKSRRYVYFGNPIMSANQNVNSMIRISVVGFQDIRGMRMIRLRQE